ncbi:MAG: YceI family protein [Acidimicrobiales bacterium]
MKRFRIDPSRSQLRIEGRSSLHPIRAEATNLRGWVEVDPLPEGGLNTEEGAKGTLELPVDELSSGNVLYDREIRRRVDTRRHPMILAELTDVTETDVEGLCEVSGTVSFRGRTNSYHDRMAISFPEPDQMRLEGGHTFDIRDFGLEPPRILALRVHPDVLVSVNLLARAEGVD